MPNFSEELLTIRAHDNSCDVIRREVDIDTLKDIQSGICGKYKDVIVKCANDDEFSLTLQHLIEGVENGNLVFSKIEAIYDVHSVGYDYLTIWLTR